MLRPFRSLIFDLDGTLVDSLSDIAAAMNAALAEQDLPLHAVSDYAGKVGWGMRRLAELALPADRRGSRYIDSLVLSASRHYSATPVLHSRLYLGVDVLVRRLAAAGVPMAVVSNKPEALVRRIVDRFFPPRTFRVVRGARAGGPVKPDPGAFLEAAVLIGVGQGQVVVVGDGETDMEAANRAGMGSIGVLWGFRDMITLKAAGADILVSSTHELDRLLSVFCRGGRRRV